MRSIVCILVLSVGVEAQTIVLSWAASSQNQFLGAALAGPGDLDGDGIPDLVIGSADLVNNSVPGSVTARSGFDGSILWQVPGGVGDGLGVAVAVAGDVDGDNVADLVASAPGGPLAAGYAVVLAGATGAVIRTFNDPSRVVDGGRDFNGDGVSDQLVGYGSPFSGGTGLKIYSGFDGSVLLAVTAATYGFPAFDIVNARFIADVHGDGFDDVVVGTGVGSSAALIRGPTGAIYGGLGFGGTSPAPWVGGVHDVGSVTQDAFHDVGITHHSFALGVFTEVFQVRNSATGAIVWQRQTSPASLLTPGLAFGGVASFPDITGDGRPELVFGGGVPVGATVLSGADGAVVLTVPLTVPTSLGNGSAAVVGDVTGDGIPEFALGNPGASAGGFAQGGFVAVVSAVTLPGPTVTDLGGACGSSQPLLTATPLRFGSATTISLTGGPPAAAALLVVDFAAAVPTVVGPCTFHVDLAHWGAWIQLPVALDPLGAASIQAGVPTIPALVQHPVTLQVVIVGTSSPSGFDLSNGLVATLGY